MKPLALTAARQGYKVIGSDQNWLHQSKELIAAGVEGWVRPMPELAASADCYVFSSAIRFDHPERLAAGEAAVPTFHRMELLNLLVGSAKVRFAVAGTHGKTSSTSMAGWVLLEAGLDPTILAGGHPLYLPEGCRNGRGEVAVFETDESDGSFLKTETAYRLILNIDRDHLNHYGSFEKLGEAFRQFAAEKTVYNLNDAKLRSLFNGIPSLIGFGEVDASFQGPAYVGRFQGDSLSVKWQGAERSPAIKNSQPQWIHLKTPGRHFAMNALGVIAMIHTAIQNEPILQRRFDPADPKTISELVAIINEFPGVERRLQKIGTLNGIDVYDDYGHHPTEIRAVITALKERGVTPLSVVFQPHRYTRTRELAAEFADVLALADQVYLLPIYSAGEPAIEGVSSDCIARRMKADVIDPINLDQVFERRPAAVLFQGAGSVSAIGRDYFDKAKSHLNT